MKPYLLIESLNLKVYAKGRDFEIKNGYTCDLLSVVMANCPENSIWVTVQRHINIVAVASLREIRAIIISQGISPEENIIEKSEEEGIWLLGTNDDSFTVSGKIYSLLKDEKNNG